MTLTITMPTTTNITTLCQNAMAVNTRLTTTYITVVTHHATKPNQSHTTMRRVVDMVVTKITTMETHTIPVVITKDVAMAMAMIKVARVVTTERKMAIAADVDKTIARAATIMLGTRLEKIVDVAVEETVINASTRRVIMMARNMIKKAIAQNQTTNQARITTTGHRATTTTNLKMTTATSQTITMTTTMDTKTMDTATTTINQVAMDMATTIQNKSSTMTTSE